MSQILELLQEVRPDVDFTASSDFIGDYLLDSFDVITLTSELEEKYNIQIPIHCIVPEDFISVDAIADLVRTCGGII